MQIYNKIIDKIFYLIIYLLVVFNQLPIVLYIFSKENLKLAVHRVNIITNIGKHYTGGLSEVLLTQCRTLESLCNHVCLPVLSLNLSEQTML